MAEMTDNEIIKALECCSVGTFACDEQCPCFHSKSNLKVTSCRFELIGDALDLINRQKAEIKRVNGVIKNFKATKNRQRAEIERLNRNIELLAICKKDLPQKTTEAIKAEAIKEFVEAYKYQIEDCTGMFTDEGFYIPRNAVLNAIDFIYERLAGEG